MSERMKIAGLKAQKLKKRKSNLPMYKELYPVLYGKFGVEESLDKLFKQKTVERKFNGR